MGTELKPEVLVVGSSNTDLVIRMRRLPSPEKLALETGFSRLRGVKARLWLQRAFVSRVGGDDFDSTSIETLEKEEIDTRYVLTDPDLPSGVAFILVDEQGENTIVVAPGANAALSPTQLDAAAPAFEHADICLLQLETPLPTVSYAIQLARDQGLRVILNPASAQALPSDLLRSVPADPERVGGPVFNRHRSRYGQGCPEGSNTAPAKGCEVRPDCARTRGSPTRNPRG